MATSSGLRPRHVPLIVIGLAVVGLAVWLVLPNTSPTSPATESLSDSDPRAVILAEVTKPLDAPFDLAMGRVAALAQTLPQTPEALAQALAQAHRDKDGLLPARIFPGAAPEVPRAPETLAEAFAQKRKTQVCSFELAGLLGALLRARGLAPEYGVVPKARFDATELLARRFAVRVAGGPWLAPDGGSTEGTTPLDTYTLAAYTLGFRALGAIARADVDTASRAAGLARRLAPDDPALMFVSAEVSSVNLMADEAMRMFEAAAAVRADAMTWYRLGRQARVDQKPFKADANYKKATEVDPAFAAPWVELAELTLERIDLTPKDEHPAIKAQAETYLDAASKADPNAPGLRIARAHLFTLSGDAQDAGAAIKLLEEEVELHPGREEGWIVLANVYAAEERDADAIKTLEKARDNGIETPDVYEGLGSLYGVTGRFDDGKRALERALALAPEHATLRTQLAQFEHQTGNIAHTRELLNAQLAKFPEDATSALLLAQVELEQGDLVKAEQVASQVLKRDPNHKEGRVLAHIIAAIAQKATDETRREAEEALGGPRPLAELLLRNGMTAEAEVVLKGALARTKLGEAEEDLVIPVLLVALQTAQGRTAEASALREATLAKLPVAQRSEIQKLFEEAMSQAVKAHEGPSGEP
jgi:tetratricopeptide (TPR) repeat protein